MFYSSVKRRFWPILSCVIALLTGCSDNQSPSIDGDMNSLASGWDLLLEQADWPKSQDGLELPADLGFHPNAPFESFVARVVLTDRNETSEGIFVQLDRIDIPKTIDSTSQWSYRSITRSTIVHSKFPEPSSKVEYARLALGLSTANSKLLAVGNTQLSIAEPRSCNQNWRLSGTIGKSPFSFLAITSDCPTQNDLGDIKQWEYPFVPIFGEINNESVRGDVTKGLCRVPSPLIS